MDDWGFLEWFTLGNTQILVFDEPDGIQFWNVIEVAETDNCSFSE